MLDPDIIRQPSGPELVVWSIRETAHALGVSERTAWSFMKSGELPCVRLGRLVRFRPADVRRFVDARMTAGVPDARLNPHGSRCEPGPADNGSIAR